METSPEEKAKIKEKINKLKESKFKQQTLPAWRPVPTAMSTIITFTAFAVFFLGIGILLFVMSGKIIEESVQYNENCYPSTGVWNTPTERNIFPLGTRFQDPNITADETPMYFCAKPENVIHIKEDLPAGEKIFLYYQLDNFYQNHRRYVKSRSNTQLDGGDKKLMTADEVKSDCDPVWQNKNLWYNQQFSWSAIKKFTSKAAMESLPAADKLPDLDPSAAATPCGLIAKSLFNDTYRIIYSETKEGLANGVVVQQMKKGKKCEVSESESCISHDNIAWASDVSYKFKNTPVPWESKQWWDMTDEHFIVWMRTAGLPNFRKLWGNMTNVKKGYYQIQINNQFNVKPYDGKKFFVMSTTNSLGGKNYFLAICYICVGVFCIIFALVFLVVHIKRSGSHTD